MKWNHLITEVTIANPYYFPSKSYIHKSHRNRSVRNILFYIVIIDLLVNFVVVANKKTNERIFICCYYFYFIIILT